MRIGSYIQLSLNQHHSNPRAPDSVALGAYVSADICMLHAIENPASSRAKNETEWVTVWRRVAR